MTNLHQRKLTSSDAKHVNETYWNPVAKIRSGIAAEMRTFQNHRLQVSYV